MIMTFNETLDEAKNLYEQQENDVSAYILLTGAWVAFALLGKSKLAILSGLAMAFVAGHRAVVTKRLREDLDGMGKLHDIARG